MNTTASRTRLLIIDDDTKFCRLISEYLARFGYEVFAVHNGLEALQVAATGDWKAVILDVMIPGADGFEVLGKIRELSNMPILMLTALGEETDRIVGLEMGADDYLPKTSSPRELLARLRAVLRRTSSAVNDHGAGCAPSEITIGPLVISLGARIAFLDDEPLALTPVEFDLLVVLAQARGRIKTREELINEIRDRNYEVFDRSVDVHISALRKKLHDDPRSPRFIRTVRSAGYMLLRPQEMTR
ncbi:MAG: winged helix-turn-helix domain-containing protein [Candidatus Binatia bacterium]